MSPPAVSPFSSARPLPPPVPPSESPPVCDFSNRAVIPPPVVARSAIALPEPPPRLNEIGGNASQRLSTMSYGLIVFVVVAYGVAAKVVWEKSYGVSTTDAVPAVAESMTQEPLNESPTASGLTLAVHKEAPVAVMDPAVLWPTDTALEDLARAVDDDFDAAPPEDEREILRVDKVINIAEVIEFSRPPVDVGTTSVTTASESTAESANSSHDGARPAASDARVAADSKSATAECSDGMCAAPRKLGTLIDWAPTAERAGEIASKEGKLVFLMQVSGNFARQEFT